MTANSCAAGVRKATVWQGVPPGKSRRKLASGKLVTVLDEFALPNYDIIAVYSRQIYLPLKTRLFIDHLETIYSTTKYWTRPH